MCYHDDCQISLLLLLDIKDGVLDFSLTLGVKSARRFIKHQNFGLFDESSGDCNTLLLSS
jgi:hypothetical protein